MAFLKRCNQMSAEIWNLCVEKDLSFKEQNGRAMRYGELQTLVKGKTNLHANGAAYVMRKYYYARSSMWASILAKHKDSGKAKLPYKHKLFFNTGWTKGYIFPDDNKGVIELTRKLADKGNGHHYRQRRIRCYAKTIPPNIVEIELVYRQGLKLAVKYKDPDIPLDQHIQSNNVASIDLGEIHAITAIDNNGHSIIITGRKLRSIKRFRDKEHNKLRSKQDKCIRGSRQYMKYNRAIHRLSYKAEKQILDCIHKISKLFLDYCLKYHIGTVYYGDLENATRNIAGRVNKITANKLTEWNHGLLMIQMENKLTRYGIKLIKVQEYYTSKSCPDCGSLNKPKGRNYVCDCGYTQHRDIVGAINILNFNAGTKLQKYNTKEYLRIA